MTDTVPLAIFAALNPIFPSKVFPSTAPDDTAPPYLVYSCITTNPEQTLQGVALDNDKFQFDTYSLTYEEARTLARQVRTAILAFAYPISVFLDFEVDEYDPDVKFHRVVQQFSIWHP